MCAERVPSSKLLTAGVRLAGSALLLALTAAAAFHLDFQQPFIGYGLGGAFLLFLATKPEKWRTVIVLALGTVVAAIVTRGHFEVSPTLLVQAMGALGLSSLLCLGCLVLWEGRENEAAAYRAILPGAVLTFLILGAQYSLNMASLLHPRTYDLYAYVFDGALGFQPSFVLGRILNQNPWMFPLVKLSYEGIVLAMAALYAAFMTRRNKPVWELIELLFAPAMIGYLFFSIFPVCGPRYAFPQNFPAFDLPYRFLHQLTLEPISVLPVFPRNGVPSLHMTWALLIWINARGLPRWMRATAAALALATVFDTLATGEHYLFDLVVALPFTLCMQACLARTVSFLDPKRWKPALAGGAMFLAWLVIGRFGLRWMLASPALPWLLVLASSELSLHWISSLPAMIPEMQVHIEPKVRAMSAAAAR
jgi:PAP2 superfamily